MWLTCKDICFDVVHNGKHALRSPSILGFQPALPPKALALAEELLWLRSPPIITQRGSWADPIIKIIFFIYYKKCKTRVNESVLDTLVQYVKNVISTWPHQLVNMGLKNWPSIYLMKWVKENEYFNVFTWNYLIITKSRAFFQEGIFLQAYFC